MSRVRESTGELAAFMFFRHVTKVQRLVGNLVVMFFLVWLPNPLAYGSQMGTLFMLQHTTSCLVRTYNITTKSSSVMSMHERCDQTSDEWSHAEIIYKVWFITKRIAIYYHKQYCTLLYYIIQRSASKLCLQARHDGWGQVTSRSMKKLGL